MSLESIRKEIDIVDSEIQKLLEKRFALVAALKPLKNNIYDPTREEKILSNISSKWISQIYLTILDVSKKYLKSSV